MFCCCCCVGSFSINCCLDCRYGHLFYFSFNNFSLIFFLASPLQGKNFAKQLWQWTRLLCCPYSSCKQKRKMKIEVEEEIRIRITPTRTSLIVLETYLPKKILLGFFTHLPKRNQKDRWRINTKEDTLLTIRGRRRNIIMYICKQRIRYPSGEDDKTMYYVYS